LIEINENTLSELESRLKSIFNTARALSSEDYLILMTLIEFYKVKTFTTKHQAPKTFSDFLKMK